MVLYEYPDNEGNKKTFGIDKHLVQIINKVKDRVEKRDNDCVFIVDGMEGAGKSVFAMQLGKAIDPTLTLDRVCFSPKEFAIAVTKAEKKQVVIFDEAYNGLSSRNALDKVNKLLIGMMMEMRQKNLVVFIVLPSIFMLERYVVLHRSLGLFHVYLSKGRRGYFRFYGIKHKKFLYMLGKKFMSYNKPRVKLYGWFGGKYVLNEEEYRSKKDKVLRDKVEYSDDSEEESKFKVQRNALLFYIHELGLTYEKMSEITKELGIPMTIDNLSTNAVKYKRKYIDKKDNKDIDDAYDAFDRR